MLGFFFPLCHGNIGRSLIAGSLQEREVCSASAFNMVTKWKQKYTLHNLPHRTLKASQTLVTQPVRLRGLIFKG